MILLLIIVLLSDNKELLKQYERPPNYIPLVIFVYSEDCKYCKQMVQETIRQKGVNVAFICVNANEKQIPQHKINIVPAYYLVENDNILNVIRMGIGYKTREQFLKWVNND